MQKFEEALRWVWTLEVGSLIACEREWSRTSWMEGWLEEIDLSSAISLVLGWGETSSSITTLELGQGEIDYSWSVIDKTYGTSIT